MTSINSAMGIHEWAMLVALSVLWGGSFFFIGVAVSEVPPLTIVALRVGLASVALWSIALVLGLGPPKRAGVWAAFLGMGLLNNVVPFTLIAWGQVQIASGLASILNATTPLFTVIFAGMLLTDERFSALKLGGVGVGFIGVAVMIGVSASGGSGGTLAKTAIIGAAASYGLAGVYGRRFRAMAVDPVITAAGQVTASALLLTPIALAVDGTLDVADTSAGTWAAIVGLAVFSTAIAYVLYFRILGTAGATNLLLVTLLIPVSATLLGSLFLNESLEAIHFLGMALIALGLSAIDGRLWRSRMGTKAVNRTPTQNQSGRRPP